MIENLLKPKYFPLSLKEDDISMLARLEKRSPDFYEEARKYAFDFLIGLDFLDVDFCKKYGIDYVDVLCNNNINKIMVAYIRMRNERTNRIYKMIYRKRI